MFNIIKILVLSCFFMLVGCKSATPIHNVMNKPINGGYSLIDIEKSITRASIRRGWEVKKISEGNLQANINVRDRHYATISITFDQNSFNINYIKSYGLDAKNNKIHPAYNRWIAILTKDINTEIQLLSI